jgi:hypothetical protein
VLKRGFINRVGPGEINVWEDNWIPGSRSLRPFVRRLTAVVVMVRDLFVPGTRVWDEEAVRKSFMALDAVEVLKIKPSNRLENDVLAWAFERNGIYLVRSAYRLLKEDQMAATMAATGETMASGDERAWSAAWKLIVPPKVCVFWRRVLHNSLPSKAELKRRHVAMENFCEMCGDPDESVYHVVLLCPVARRFWDEVRKLTGVRIPDLHPCTWATDVLHADICPTSSAATLICGAWTLWTRRNARRHCCKVWEPGATARYISSMLEELSSLKMPPQGVKPRRQVKWQRPDERWIKVNTDAAFDSNTCTG